MERKCDFGGNCRVQRLVDQHTAFDKERITKIGELEHITDANKRRKLEAWINTLSAKQILLVEQIDERRCDSCQY